MIGIGLGGVARVVKAVVRVVNSTAIRVFSGTVIGVAGGVVIEVAGGRGIVSLSKVTTFFERAAKIKIKRASHPQTFVLQ